MFLANHWFLTMNSIGRKWKEKDTRAIHQRSRQVRVLTGPTHINVHRATCKIQAAGSFRSGDIHSPENIRTTAEIEHRRNAPIQAAIPNQASGFEWKRETGEVQSYQHTQAGSWLHIDPQGQFYDRQAQPITRETALEQAGQVSARSLGDNAQVQSISGNNNNDQGIGL